MWIGLLGFAAIPLLLTVIAVRWNIMPTDDIGVGGL
jgi:hypothetical protein